MRKISLYSFMIFLIVFSGCTDKGLADLKVQYGTVLKKKLLLCIKTDNLYENITHAELTGINKEESYLKIRFNNNTKVLVKAFQGNITIENPFGERLIMSNFETTDKIRPKDFIEIKLYPKDYHIFDYNLDELKFYWKQSKVIMDVERPSCFTYEMDGVDRYQEIDDKEYLEQRMNGLIKVNEDVEKYLKEVFN